jgi:hypothetical protein
VSLATVRASIKGVLVAASGGKVHDYLRLIEAEKAIADELMVSKKLHAWCITLDESEPFSEKRLPACHALADMAFVLHGWYAVDDSAASEKTWADLVEDVMDAYRADKKLGNTVIEAGPAQWREAGYRSYVGVLCHYARLTLSVRVQVEP